MTCWYTCTYLWKMNNSHSLLLLLVQNYMYVNNCSSMSCLIDWSHASRHVRDHVKLHASLFVQPDFHGLGFRCPIKLIWWAYLSCTCNPKMFCSNLILCVCYASINAQRIRQLLDTIWQLFLTWHNWSKLDHRRQRVKSIRP